MGSTPLVGSRKRTTLWLLRLALLLARPLLRGRPATIAVNDHARLAGVWASWGARVSLYLHCRARTGPTLALRSAARQSAGREGLLHVVRIPRGTPGDSAGAQGDARERS